MNKPAPASTPAREGANTRRVLVLGAGTGAAEAVEFLGSLDLEPAILDAPSVDKLDALRDATYAIVLPAEGDESPPMYIAIGFMLAALGRSRICLMAPDGQAVAPALEGSFRITPDDAGVWRLLLAREMKRAGLEVDLNRAL
jgi:hypothetical protein